MDVTLELLLCALALAFVLAKKFNEWPSLDSFQYSGPPRDYTDRNRYFSFLLIYILAGELVFLIVYRMPDVSINLLRLMGIEADMPAELFNQEKDRGALWATLLLMTLLNAESFKRYEEPLRKSLQRAARIPKTIEDFIHYFVRHPETFHLPEESAKPSMRRLGELNPQLADIPFERFEQDAENGSGSLHGVLRLVHLAELLKEQHLSDLVAVNRRYDADFDHLYDELKELLSDLEWDGKTLNTPLSFSEESHRILRKLYEFVAIVVVRQANNLAQQRRRFAEFGLILNYVDSSPRLANLLLLSVLSIVAICLLSTLVFWLLFELSDQPSVSGAAPNYAPRSLSEAFFWASSGTLLHMMAVLSGIIMFKLNTVSGSSEEEQHSPLRTYASVAAVAYVVSLSFLNLISKKPMGENFSLLFAFIPTATSLLAARNLERYLEFHTYRDLWRNAIRQSGVLFFVAALVCSAMAIALHRPPWADMSMAKFIAYAAVMNGMIGFAIGYLFAWELRAQLMVRSRRAPRLRCSYAVQVEGSGEGMKCYSKNLSQGGIMVCRGGLGDRGEVISLNLAFGKLRGNIAWCNEGYTGIRFDPSDTQGSAQLRQHIRETYGSQYLVA